MYLEEEEVIARLVPPTPAAKANLWRKMLQSQTQQSQSQTQQTQQQSQGATVYDAADAEHTQAAWGALGLHLDDDPYFLTRHHIDSYDSFLESDAAPIVQSMNPLTMIKTEGEHIIRVDVDVAPNGLYLDRPTVLDVSEGGGGANGGLRQRPLFPCEARLRDLTYAIRLHADIRITYTVDGKPLGEPVTLKDRVNIGSVPLLVHSRHCLLHNLPKAALREAGECQFDQGGYFVIDGKEKVVVSREDGVRNRLYVETIREGVTGADKDAVAVGIVRSTSPLDAFPRTTRVRVRSLQAPSRPGAITVEIDHFGRSSPNSNDTSHHEQVPLFVMFRALGVESDRAIVQHIVHDVDAAEEADIVEFLRASVLDARSQNIMTQRDAFAALAPATKYGSQEHVKRTIVENLYPNAGDAFGHKALLLGHVVRKVIRAVLGKDAMLDRDDYTNKRVRLTGHLMADLFRDLYYRLRYVFMSRMDNEYLTGPWRGGGGVGEIGNLRSLINETNIGAMVSSAVVTEGMITSFKGSWGPPKQEGLDAVGGDDAHEEENVVQDLNRMSYLTYVSHVRRVNNPIDRSIKLAAPHRLLPSHWGAVCPVESPDGPNIGLLKHMAIGCFIVPTAADPGPIEAHLVKMGLARSLDRYLAASSAPSAVAALRSLRGCVKVFFNDTWSCVTQRPDELTEYVRTMRRKGLIPLHTSVAWDVLAGEIYVATDAGRCCRALVRCDVEGGGGDGAGSRTSRAQVADLSSAVRAASLRHPTGSGSGSGSGSSHATTASGSGSGSSSRPFFVSSRWQSLFVPPGSAAKDGKDVAAGPLDLIDVAELRTRMVAFWPSDLRRRPNVPFTHCELHPTFALSASACTHPLMNHNNGNRNVLAMAQFKQALGVYTSSFSKRMDTMGGIMTSPQLPLFSTNYADRLCQGRHGHGQNLVVAICCYSGYNQEDAIILNRESVERGLLQVTIYKTHRFEEMPPGEEVDGATGDVTTTALMFANPTDIEASGRGAVESMSIDMGYDKLGADGLPIRNARIGEEDALLGCVQVSQVRVAQKGHLHGGAAGSSRQSKSATAPIQTTYTDRSQVAGRTMSGHVDHVLTYAAPVPGGGGGGGADGGGGPRACKIRMRQMRPPDLGDKMASRFGQKGVVGLLMPAADMPYTHQHGLTPDMIFNPMGLTTRMTVSHLLECLISKAGASSGCKYNANTFEPADVVGEAEATLERLGLHRHGEEIMYNGRTGEMMKVNVFVGVNYYGRLKHMVKDKYQYRSRGRVNAITRQPVKSENESGGLRIGEMEQNALVAHGLSSFVKESLMERSDKTHAHVEARTGTLLGSAKVPRTNRAPFTGEGAPPGAVASIETPNAFRLLAQELQGLHVDMRFPGLSDATGVSALVRCGDGASRAAQDNGGGGDDDSDASSASEGANYEDDGSEMADDGLDEALGADEGMDDVMANGDYE